MRHNRHGFTVLELLVAATVTVLLAGFLLVVISGALDIWKRAKGGMTANTQVKLVFDLLERDLQAAIYREEGEAQLAVDVINNTASLSTHGWRTSGAIMKPAGVQSLRLLSESKVSPEQRIAWARFGVSGAWLRFVTTNVESGGSLPIVVSYQIARRPVSGNISGVNPASVRYTLFRSVVSTDRTFGGGYSVDAPVYGYVSNVAPNTRSEGTVTNPNNSDALCSNVVDFGVWLYKRNVDGSLLRIFPSSGVDMLHRGFGTRGTGNDNEFPDVADIMVRLLSEEGAAQLESIERGRVTRPAVYSYDADWWWAVVEANSEVFVIRIHIGREKP